MRNAPEDLDLGARVQAGRLERAYPASPIWLCM